MGRRAVGERRGDRVAGELERTVLVAHAQRQWPSERAIAAVDRPRRPRRRWPRLRGSGRSRRADRLWTASRASSMHTARAAFAARRGRRSPSRPHGSCRAARDEAVPHSVYACYRGVQVRAGKGCWRAVAADRLSTEARPHAPVASRVSATAQCPRWRTSKQSSITAAEGGLDARRNQTRRDRGRAAMSGDSLV
jgi:hypothetical protein